MGTPGLRRLCKAALCALALLAATPCMHARQILDLDVQRQPAQLLDWGDYLIDPQGSFTLKQVLAQPQNFQPTRLDNAYPLADGAVLWIKFVVPAAPDEQRWYLKLASPGLDGAVLYTQSNDRNRYTAQASGDEVPVASWPIPHLYPVLPLAVSAADPTWYVLRIKASEGFFAPVEFISEARLSLEIQRQSLGYGVCFGLLAMGALFALATSVALRDGAYCWFGVWAAVASLALMAAVGVAGLHLWPTEAKWNDGAPYVLALASLGPLLVFVAEALLLRDRSREVWIAVMALAGATLLAALGSFALKGALRLYLTLATALVAAGAIVALGVWSRRHGNRFGLRLVVALAPLLLAFPPYALALLQAPLPWLNDSVLAVAALGISASACYLLLALRSQERRDHRRRIAQLGEIDPTTGLINEAVFAQRARTLIHQAHRFGHQSVIAIVDFANFADLRREFGRKRGIELVLRLADRLTSMLRTVDSVARLGEARFGVLVEGPLAGSRAKSFGAKVIANCIGPLSGLPQGMLPKPKVAIALVPEHGTDVQEVVARLESLLKDARPDPARSIIMAGPLDVRTVHIAPTVPFPHEDSLSTAPTLPGESLLARNSEPDEVDAES